MNLLMVGDVFGENGMSYLEKTLPGLVRQEKIRFCVVNGENAAEGNGVSKECVQRIFAAGAQVITTGNHAFRRKSVLPLYESEPYLLRPRNFPRNTPGKGFCIYDMGFTSVAVVNLCGMTFMEGFNNPFEAADHMLKDMGTEAKTILVDFHAEATSEKRALGYYLDGRVTAVVGTHTHVQTSDECLLPKGTAYISDLGMTGPQESVLGIRPASGIARFTTRMPVKFETAPGSSKLEGVILTVDPASGKPERIRRIRIKEESKNGGT